MVRFQELVNEAKRAYTGSNSRNDNGDPLLIAAGQALPQDERAYLDLMAEDITLLTEGMVVRITPGNIGISPLELIRQRVFDRIKAALEEWIGAAGQEWQCAHCGRRNKGRETCGVCWMVRA